MSFLCHSYVTRMCSYVIHMSLVCHPDVTRKHLYVIRMSLVCRCISSVYHSYVICMSLVCTRMSFVCHSYVYICHLYVTHMWFNHEIFYTDQKKHKRIFYCNGANVTCHTQFLGNNIGKIVNLKNRTNNIKDVI